MRHNAGSLVDHCLIFVHKKILAAHVLKVLIKNQNRLIVLCCLVCNSAKAIVVICACRGDLWVCWSSVYIGLKVVADS